MLETDKRYIDAKVREAEARARRLDLECVSLQNEVDFELAAANKAQIFSFFTTVKPTAVDETLQILDKWSRLYPEKSFTFQINSPGGSVIDGFALFDFLRELSRRGHHVTTKVFGQASSMAAVLTQAGDKRIIAKNAWIMLHEPGIHYNEEASRQLAELDDDKRFLDRINERVVAILGERSNIPKTKLKKMWAKTDVWLDADECIKYGLVDEIQ